MGYLLAIGIGAVAIVASWLGVLSSWNLGLTDRFYLPRLTDPQVVIVAIDDASITALGRWPWSREIHANLIRKITEGGALAIGYDVNFPEASDAAQDQALADAIRASGKVVLPEELTIHTQPEKGLVYENSLSVAPIPVIASAAKQLAHTNIPLDVDNTARRLPLVVQGDNGQSATAFAYALATMTGRAIPVSDIPHDALGQVRINFSGMPGTNFTTVTAGDVINGKVDPKTFRDKVVLVGATARNLHDVQSVPTSGGDLMSGVEIHASIFDTIVNQRWLQEIPFEYQAMILLVLALGLAVLVRNTRPRYSVLVVFGFLIVLLIGAFIAFDQGWVIDVVWPAIVVGVGYIALLLERWVETESQRRQTRHAFSRYVSNTVVDALLKHPDKMKLGGERRHMSVLFSDLRGFTTLSEGLTPEQLVEVLNKYLHEMTNIVFDEQGVLDKYIGDAVMAFWNAPFDQSHHALHAVYAAIRMRDKLKAMNVAGAFPPGIELKVGIGINTGDMVVGNIGGESRYDYTVIGDSVNLASRTEGLCKEYGVEIIITESTRNEIGEQVLVRMLDKVAVKGKKEPIVIYQVICSADQITEELRRKVTRSEEALSLYLKGEFEEAIQKCDAFLEIWPDDVPVKNVRTRCEIYLDNSPPPGWDGTWVMTKK